MVGFVAGYFFAGLDLVAGGCVSLTCIELYLQSSHTNLQTFTQPQSPAHQLTFVVAVLKAAGDDTFFSRLEFCEVVFNNGIIWREYHLLFFKQAKEAVLLLSR